MDSFMYQTVGHDTIDLQVECIGLPLYREYITGQSIDQALHYSTTPGDETEDLFRLLSNVKARQPDIQAVSAGAILSNYQRIRVENVCARLGLTCLAYLWQQDQQELLAEMVSVGLTAIVIKVAALGIRLARMLIIRIKEHASGKNVGGIAADVRIARSLLPGVANLEWKVRPARLRRRRRVRELRNRLSVMEKEDREVAFPQVSDLT
jgi:Diphthamide synthase